MTIKSSGEPEVPVTEVPTSWTLTSAEDEKRILSVLLADGIWHPVLNGSFHAETGEKDNYAVWQENEAFRTACPLSQVLALRVVIRK
jgi:hypothetical protein